MNKSDAVEHYGTQTALAAALGISQAAVSKWPDLVPEKQAMKLAMLTAGRLSYDQSLYVAPSPGLRDPVCQVAVG